MATDGVAEAALDFPGGLVLPSEHSSPRDHVRALADTVVTEYGLAGDDALVLAACYVGAGAS
jgi:hypothetical protein